MITQPDSTCDRWRHLWYKEANILMPIIKILQLVVQLQVVYAFLVRNLSTKYVCKSIGIMS